jgi:hypothetical protein
MFFIACTDNPSTIDNKCDNKCNIENEKSCSNNASMICKKDENGCLFLEKVEDCLNTCELGICKNEETNCIPACEDWQTCNNTVCETSIGKCVSSNDCTDDKICSNHECIENNVEVKKVTKITMGSGNNISSSNLKLKLNVGKISTTKETKSSNFKLNLGTINIDQNK